MWHIVSRKSKKRIFEERTFHFGKAQMDEIRETCKDVLSLSNGRWHSNDPRRRKDQLHTLDLARAGEMAVYTLLRLTKPKWVVHPPDFTRREKGKRDRGDIRVDIGKKTYWVEVKTTTNRWGRHNRRNVTAVASKLGYVFQKLIRVRGKMVLTPTFDKKSPRHKKANERLLVGCVGTYMNGGCSITVSRESFLLPVSECKWQRLRKYDEGEEDLKMAHCDTICL